ncbi:protein kinase [Streptomyces sp. SL13]|uniref:non-specific serine/threonine protein kinase n=1 Tax=Streptantibioticus silvisoli TaxID=2705255 RepID=A0AA90KGI3_9ACTN|nr:protein kinase [Streptantibioticus silvisoli]MDI5964278.1 protein kinase [Streptantibioticus silvisoli]MDI5970620.1 protein kinase [Streptantibioticus silvisoli]
MDHTQAASDDPDQSKAPGDPTGRPAGPGDDTPAESVAQFGDNGLIGDGRYRLTRRLGRGGMAEVYAAEDVRLGRTVAVKLMRGDLAEDPISKARFTREAQSVAGLNHHSIVAVYDSGEDRYGQDTVPYIVMELCEGRTIRELLVDSDAPPVEQALVIVSGVLDALAYSHQHGIVHRDIKPANVVITHAGAVKVMDFGIARALHGASTTMTQTGMVMGTPQYLSPEQALGKAVDHRSDLYATGCLLYELLALRPPFMGETPLSVVYQHVQDDPRVPSTVSDRVPPELDGLVLRALAKDPDDRFQSAEEMHGLVQYALRMLAESGGWTGTWDTGYVDHAATTALPGPAATTVLPGHSGNTAELGPPLIMGPPIGPDEPAYGYADAAPAHRGRNVFLVLVAALVAIGIGVFIALNAAQNHGNGHTPLSPASPRVADSGGPASQPTRTGSQDGDQSTASPSWTRTDQPSNPYPSKSATTSQPPSTAPASTPPATTPPPSTPPPSTPPASDGGSDGGSSPSLPPILGGSSGGSGGDSNGQGGNDT